MTRSVSFVSLRSATALLATAGLLTSAACTSSGGKKPTPSTSSTPTGTTSTSSGTASTPSQDQLTATLIGGGDIPGDTFKLNTTSPIAQSGAVGVAGQFSNPDASRQLTDILIHFPTSGDAATALAAEKGSAVTAITSGLSTSDSSVGTGGKIFAGTGPTGPVSVLVFVEGNYVVTLEFQSKSASDSVPTSIVNQVGAAQDSKVKAAS
jgi:hypothetical protein